jgi:putative aldouronate transport system substrate-binding protein
MTPKNKKRLGASVLFILAAGTIIAGCSDKKGASPSPDGSAAGSPAASATPVVRKEISSTVYDRSNVPSTEGTTEDNRWTKWINKNGPEDVKFVAVPRFESRQKLNVLFASASAPDLIFEYDQYIKNPLYDQKQLMPIDDLIEKYSMEYKKLLKEYPILRKVGTKSDGKLYEFARLSEVVPIHAILIREDWLKKLNLKVPTTTEEMYQVAKAFTEQDPDGNGKKDTYGMAISLQSGNVIDQVFQATNWVVKDGSLTRNFENYKAATEFKKRLFDEGIVDKDYLNDKNGAKAKQDFINGKIGIYPIQLDWYSFTINELASLKKNVPDAVVTPIAYPKSPAGQFNPAYTNPVQATAVVNAHAKNPDAVMKYVDFLVKPETAKALKYGIEGEHWKLGPNGCPQIIDTNKQKTEVSYNGDLQMLSSSILDTKCGKIENKFNPDNPLEKEGLAMFKKAMEIYTDPNKPYVDITHPEHMPQIPKEIDTISANLTKPVGDLWVKAILGGKDYTPEQALKDAQATWEKGDGKKVEEWFANWWKNDSKNNFLAKDIIDMMKQQTGKK